MPITLSGTGGAIVTSITASGDFSQTNDCTAPLSGTTTCTINVVFTPTVEGSRNGSVMVVSNAPSSPTTVTLSGTGTYAVPDPFNFIELHGVDPSSVQISNAITVAGTNVSSPISVTGGEYSINGGAFTATAGVVSPGAQVRARVTASSVFGTPTEAVVTIGGVAAPFTVVTRDAEPGTIGFTRSTYAGNGSQPTATLAVARTGGTDGAVSVEIVDAAGMVLGTASFGAGVSGTVNVVVALTGAAGGETLPLHLAGATGGVGVGPIVDATLEVTAAPLGTVTVKSGGTGAISILTLILLGLLIVLRVANARRTLAMVGTAMITVTALYMGTARAADGADVSSSFYVGARAGASIGTLSDHVLTGDLLGAGFQVQAGVERSTATGTVYGGYYLRKDLSLELAWTYLGWTRATLSGTTPVNLNELLNDTADHTRGSGDAYSLALRYRFALSPRIALDARAGGYCWFTDTNVWVGSVWRLSRGDNGTGFTVGAGPNYSLTDHVRLGLSVDHFASTSENRFWQETATLEYRF